MRRRANASKKRVAVMPPVVTRPDTLPLLDSQLSWDGFERFIRHLVRLQHGVQDVKRYGKAGSKQRGIDLIATLDNGERWVFQCKQYSAFKIADAKKAVAKTTYAAKKYFLIIACQTDSAVHDYIEAQKNWELWDVERVSDEVLKLASEAGRDLVSRFFGQDWCRAFLGVPSSNSSTERKFPRPYSSAARPHGNEFILTRETLYEEDFENRAIICPLAWEGVLEESKRSKIVAVHAPPGSGKSTLAAWLDWKLSKETHVEYLAGRDFQSQGVAALAEELNALTDEAVVLLDDAHLVQRQLDHLLRSPKANKMRFLLFSRPGGFANLPVVPWPGDLCAAAKSIAKEMAKKYTATAAEASALLLESQGDLVFTKWLLGAMQENPSQRNPTLDATVTTKLKQFWDIDKELLRLLLVLSAYRWLELPCSIEALTGRFGFASGVVEILVGRLREARLDGSTNSLVLDRHPKLAELFHKTASRFQYYVADVLKPTCAPFHVDHSLLKQACFGHVVLGFAVASDAMRASDVTTRLPFLASRSDCAELCKTAACIESTLNPAMDGLDAAIIERRLTIAFSAYDAMRREIDEEHAWKLLTELRARLGVAGNPTMPFEAKGYLLYQVGFHYLLINQLAEALYYLKESAEVDDQWAKHQNATLHFGKAAMSRIAAARAAADVLLSVGDGPEDPKPDMQKVSDLAEKLDAERVRLEGLVDDAAGMDWFWLQRWYLNALLHLAELRACLGNRASMELLTEKATAVSVGIGLETSARQSTKLAQATLAFHERRFQTVVDLLEDIPAKQQKAGERSGRFAQLLAIAYRALGNIEEHKRWCRWLATECAADKGNGPAVTWAKAVLKIGNASLG